MSTIFTKIINGEIPCYKIAEDENYFAFLDINPLSKGHTLVIPKKEVDYIFDLDGETYQGLMNFCRVVAAAIEKVIPCQRIGLMVFGLEVPHAHVHLIPINAPGDMNMSKEKLKLTTEEFQDISQKISEQISY